MGGPCSTHGRKEKFMYGLGGEGVGCLKAKSSFGIPWRIREETTEQDGVEWIHLN